MHNSEYPDGHTGSNEYLALDSTFQKSQLLKQARVRRPPPPRNNPADSTKNGGRNRPISLKTDLGTPRFSVDASKNPQEKKLPKKKRTAEPLKKKYSVARVNARSRNARSRVRALPENSVSASFSLPSMSDGLNPSKLFEAWMIWIKTRPLLPLAICLSFIAGIMVAGWWGADEPPPPVAATVNTQSSPSSVYGQPSYKTQPTQNSSDAGMRTRVQSGSVNRYPGEQSTYPDTRYSDAETPQHSSWQNRSSRGRDDRGEEANPSVSVPWSQYDSDRSRPAYPQYPEPQRYNPWFPEAPQYR